MNARRRERAKFDRVDMKLRIGQMGSFNARVPLFIIQMAFLPQSLKMVLAAEVVFLDDTFKIALSVLLLANTFTCRTIFFEILPTNWRCRLKTALCKFAAPNAVIIQAMYITWCITCPPSRL